MTEDLSISAVRVVLDQLVEVWEDQNDARKRLDDYKASFSPPVTPIEFADVDAFLDYDSRKQRYEARLGDHESTLAMAEYKYADAASQLQEVLPEGVPLRYRYEGERDELNGTEYVIVHRHGEIVIEEPSKTAS